jgi:hypothetical protein
MANAKILLASSKNDPLYNLLLSRKKYSVSTVIEGDDTIPTESDGKKLVALINKLHPDYIVLTNDTNGLFFAKHIPGDYIVKTIVVGEKMPTSYEQGEYKPLGICYFATQTQLWTPGLEALMK